MPRTHVVWSRVVGLLVVLIALVTAERVEAQRWVCVTPAGCAADVVSGATEHPFVLRLEDPAGYPANDVAVQVSPQGAPVIFLDGRAKSDTNGYVVGYVEGKARAVTFQAHIRGEWIEQKVTFRDPAHTLVVDEKRYHWWAGSQVRPQPGVRIPGLGETSTCSALIVRFEPVTPSTVTADSVPGRVEDGDCVFRTNWRLANEVGRQQMQATIGSSRPVHLTAVSRRKSSLRVSLAAAYVEEPSVLATTKGRTYSVTRTDPVTGATIKYDSTETSKAVTESDRDLQAMPLILFDTPILARWTGVRLAVGADPRNFTRDFFIGASLLQPFYGVDIEDVGVDLQVGLILNRDRRLESPVACGTAIGTAAEEARCDTTQDFWISGGAVTLSVDAQGLISAFKNVLGIGG